MRARAHTRTHTHTHTHRYIYIYRFFFQDDYMSKGSCPPIGSVEVEDVAELACDLLNCFCIFSNFWNWRNCWNSLSESESESFWSWIGALELDFGVEEESTCLETCWIWCWIFLPVLRNSLTVDSEHRVWLNLSHHLILNSRKRLIGNLSAME